MLTRRDWEAWVRCSGGNDGGSTEIHEAKVSARIINYNRIPSCGKRHALRSSSSRSGYATARFK